MLPVISATLGTRLEAGAARTFRGSKLLSYTSCTSGRSSSDGGRSASVNLTTSEALKSTSKKVNSCNGVNRIDAFLLITDNCIK